MASEEGDVKIFRSILKEKTQREVATAFEQAGAQFAYPESGMFVWLAKCIHQIAQGQNAFDPVVFREFANLLEDSRVDGNGLIQAFS